MNDNLDIIKENNNNAIKNENFHRHNYIITKMNKERKLNKSISFGKNQKISNNKFKKYIKKLFEEDIYSLNNDCSKNKSVNVTPLYNNDYSKNKNDKIFNNLSTNNSQNNKKILFINIDSDMTKLNKTTNLMEFSKVNDIKNKQKLHIINKNINNNASFQNNQNHKNNINIIKKNNVNKSDWDEKMIKYMKQRFKNCIKKNNSKNKINNLYLKLSNKENNFEKKSKSIGKSPNSIISKGKKETLSNKSYLKSNNKIFINKENYNIKYKYYNNSTKNNTLFKNKKNNENMNVKNKKNKNLFLAADFSNVIKKSISRNKKLKNKK